MARVVRQQLIHEGFTFPWPDDVFVPPVAAFGLKELARQERPRAGGVAERAVADVPGGVRAKVGRVGPGAAGRLRDAIAYRPPNLDRVARPAG